jgi:2-amino-4-hydroxy-6-hydroxymethyldihydropteridine diphosphokinase
MPYRPKSTLEQWRILQAVVDAGGNNVLAVSPVFETDAWGGVDQGAFLNAVVVAAADVVACRMFT